MMKYEPDITPKEAARQEMELLLGQALWRVEGRGKPLAASATGGDMQAGGMFWRVCRVAWLLVQTDPEEILATPAGNNGISEILKAVRALRMVQDAKNSVETKP